MNLLFDDDLVEAVAFLCVNGRRGRLPPLQVRRFHRARERVYSLADPDERGAAFAAVHRAWFREWGAENALGEVVAQFGLLNGSLAALAFRKARAASEEGADLYVNADRERRGIVALRPELFGDDARLARFLNHELMHLTDMVNPAFGYSPDIAQPGQTVSQQRLIRERYRLLWDVTIDGRLAGARRATDGDENRRRGEFNRAFGFLPESRRAEIFLRLWSGELARHDELLALASDPRDLNAAHQPVPGAPCPLCGFATFQWADVDALGAEAVRRIQGDFPGWTPEQSACSRCLEIYSATTNLAWPSTVCGGCGVTNTSLQ